MNGFEPEQWRSRIPARGDRLCALCCCVFLVLFWIAPLACSQTAQTDSQTLQALLTEVRQLRHDLRSTNAMAQRAQIALYRLQRQDEAVVRANQRLSDIRIKLANLVTDKGEVKNQLRQVEAIVKNSQNAEEQRHSEEVLLPELKARLALVVNAEQEARVQETEAMQQVRNEQVTLDGLNDTLNRLNNVLEEMTRK